MQEIELLRELFDKKTLNILNVIINDKSEGMYLGEVSQASEVPKATTFRIVNKLVGIDVLHEIRIKRLKLYKFRRSGRTEFLFQLFKKDVKVLQIFINQIKEISGVEAIVLHGEEEKDRANVLLIGNNIDLEEMPAVNLFWKRFFPGRPL